ncbi:MAG: T9SS type A sorting domain-containing protein [Bacteroidota bacterium]
MKTLLLTLVASVGVSLCFAQYVELVEDINPGLSGTSPNQLTVANNLLFFTADDGVHGDELAVMNSDEQVTVLDITPGAVGTDPDKLIGTDTHLFFLTSNHDEGGDFESHSLWSSDGTLGGTQMLGTFPDPALSIGITGMKTTSSLLFFVTAYEDQPWRELWRSDGTPEGTFMIDVNNDLVPSLVFDDFNPATNEDELFFHGAFQGAIYRSNGTPAGTVVLVNNGVDPSPGEKILVHQNDLYYVTGGQGLRQQPLNGGNEQIIIEDWGEPAVEKLLRVVEGKLYFMARDAAHGTELWIYDPSPSLKRPVRLVKDFYLGSVSSSILDPTEYKDKIYFGAKHRGYNGQYGVLATGRELWSTTGAPLDVQQLQDINPGGEDGLSYYFYPQVYANRLFFAANDGEHGEELWVTDGYPGIKYYVDAPLNGGTFMVQDLQTGIEGSSPFHLTVYNSTLYFSANDGVHGRELHKFQIPEILPTEEITQLSPIQVYPNPTRGAFFVGWKKDASIQGRGMLTVTNHRGKVVRKEQVSFPFTQQINLSHQEPGIYVVEVAVGDQRFTEKVVIN